MCVDHQTLSIPPLVCFSEHGPFYRWGGEILVPGLWELATNSRALVGNTRMIKDYPFEI